LKHTHLLFSSLQEEEEDGEEIDLEEREKMSLEMRDRMKEGGFGELLRYI
jgi:hypothetical protein